MTQARGIWDFLRIKSAPEQKGVGLAIVGPPGCGKSTMLQHLAVTLASRQHRRYQAPVYLPIPLALRDHSAAILANKDLSLGELCNQHFGDARRFRGLNPPSGWFEHELVAGNCLVLLDGLDEVADLTQRCAISACFEKQLRITRGAAFL